MPYYSVFYKEELMYEDFIEAETPAMAMAQFKEAVVEGDVLNYDATVVECEVKVM